MENENVNQVQEQVSSEDQRDAFLEGWEDENPVEVASADQQEDTDEAADSAEAEVVAEETEQKDEAYQPEADAKEETAAGAEEAAQPSWKVRHMGEDKTVTAAEVTPELLQKGLDYDRVRSKYDESKAVVEAMTRFAEKANMPLADYVKYLREEEKKASGMSASEAKRAVDLEDREAAVSIKEAQQQEETAKKTAEEAKAQADIADFKQAFPEEYAKYKSDPATIPPKVWAEVNEGKSLTAAYAAHLVQKARNQAAAVAETEKAKALNTRNTMRSVGSMSSAGNDTKVKDPFLAGFDE